MSDTPQDDTTARGEPAAAAKQQPATERQFESTPAKKKYGPDFAFASTTADYEKVRKQLESEMEGRWLGAMPVDEFLDTYLGTSEDSAPLPTLAENPFGAVPNGGVESARYDPFITAIAGWMPHLDAVNTSTKEDTANKLKLRPDISLYNRVEGVAPPKKTDFAHMELWMEFKTNTSGVAFRDPDNATEDESRRLAIEKGSFTPATVDGINARGQLAHYAGAQHSLQFRHFSFSVVLEGDRARFLRWDPAGTVVTAAFNYRKNPEVLAEFLWRFDQLGAKDRGHDESIRPAQLEDDVDTRVREKLQIKDKKIPLFEYNLPGLDGMGHTYGPQPPYQNRSLVSRCTRSLPVVWIPKTDVKDSKNSCTESEPARGGNSQNGNAEEEDEKEPWSSERIIFMKDTWRFLSDSPGIDVLAEHEIYAQLHKVKTPNIPRLVAGGDIQNGKTKTQEMVGAPWLCVRPRISPYQHYRLGLGIVGRALTTFRCTKELVTGVLDAMKAHWHAFDVAKILHRDISVGNILLTDEGKGLLIDWELAKLADEIGRRRPDRTGTWQFMSANLLRLPGKMHVLVDDLESFLHVLGWTTLRYLPAAEFYEAEDRGDDIAMFDEYSVRQGHLDRGGLRKSNALGAGRYPSQIFHPRKATPLHGLLRTLSSPFKALYVSDPPDEALREDYEELKQTNPHNERVYRNHVVHIYDQGMERLKSCRWFISTIEDMLSRDVWPTDDNAIQNLPIASSFTTDGQDVRKTSQLQNTYSQWERSKGLPRSSKRAASPTAECGAKRRRCTPAAPGSGN